MRYLFVRWLILTAAIGLTLWIMQDRGLSVDGGLITIFGIAAVYGLVNAIVRPIVALLTCPFVVLTLGLFMFVINALMLMLTGWLVPGFAVSGFWPSFWASIIISIISAVLTSLVHDGTNW